MRMPNVYTNTTANTEYYKVLSVPSVHGDIKFVFPKLQTVEFIWAACNLIMNKIGERESMHECSVFITKNG